MQNQELPQELVEEILVRLPFKSILRFKSVSKLWRCTIESRCFGERHFLKRSHDQLQSIYFVKPAIHWFQQVLSPASLQVIIDKEKRKEHNRQGYKLVVCSSNFDVASMCEVLDFTADHTWRYAACTTSYMIAGIPHLWNGSLYWLTKPWDDGETEVVAFDLLKESFRFVLRFLFRCEHNTKIVDGGLRVWPTNRGTFFCPFRS